MKTAALSLFVAFGLAACQPPGPIEANAGALQQDREAQLTKSGELWRRAYVARDWDALRALYTDDAVLMTQGSVKIDGADKIVPFLKRLPDAGATVIFQFDNEEVSISETADLGFVTAKYRMDIAFPGRKPTTVAGRSFLVYKWQDGQWKLWRDIDNLAPDAVPEDFE